MSCDMQREQTLPWQFLYATIAMLSVWIDMLALNQQPEPLQGQQYSQQLEAVDVSTQLGACPGSRDLRAH